MRNYYGNRFWTTQEAVEGGIWQKKKKNSNKIVDKIIIDYSYAACNGRLAGWQAGSRPVGTTAMSFIQIIDNDDDDAIAS